jgi:spore coat protein CotF
MSQKIQNPQTEVANTPELNDRDYADICLNVEKKLVLGYTMALTEASNDTLYNELFKLYQDTQNKQRELYNLMFRKGWYAIEAEEKQKIDQAVQQFAGYKPQLS